MSTDMAAPQDPAGMERALDRLAEHCELTTKRQSRIEERRVAVLARLELELGPDIARPLLLSPSPVA